MSSAPPDRSNMAFYCMAVPSWLTLNDPACSDGQPASSAAACLQFTSVYISKL